MEAPSCGWLIEARLVRRRRTEAEAGLDHDEGTGQIVRQARMTGLYYSRIIAGIETSPFSSPKIEWRLGTAWLSSPFPFSAADHRHGRAGSTSNAWTLLWRTGHAPPRGGKRSKHWLIPSRSRVGTVLPWGMEGIMIRGRERNMTSAEMAQWHAGLPSSGCGEAERCPTTSQPVMTLRQLLSVRRRRMTWPLPPKDEPEVRRPSL